MTNEAVTCRLSFSLAWRRGHIIEVDFLGLGPALKKEGADSFCFLAFVSIDMIVGTQEPDPVTRYKEGSPVMLRLWETRHKRGRIILDSS